MYAWLVYLHVSAVVVFVMLHAVQIAGGWAFTLGKPPQGDATRPIDRMIDAVIIPTYVALLVVIATGLVLVAMANLWTAGWVLASIALALGLGIGKGFVAFRKYPWRMPVLTAVGVVGLLAILWLMVLKPF